MAVHKAGIVVTVRAWHNSATEALEEGQLYTSGDQPAVTSSYHHHHQRDEIEDRLHTIQSDAAATGGEVEGGGPPLDGGCDFSTIDATAAKATWALSMMLLTAAAAQLLFSKPFVCCCCCWINSTSPDLIRFALIDSLSSIGESRFRDCSCIVSSGGVEGGDGTVGTAVGGGASVNVGSIASPDAVMV
jgi:hypothetical protein